MGHVVVLGVLDLVLRISTFAWILGAQGAAVTPVVEGNPGKLFDANVFINIAPSPVEVPLPDGMGAQPPVVMPPLESAPGPQTAKGLAPSDTPSPSASSPSNPFIPPPPQPPHAAPLPIEAPAPVASPSNISLPPPSDNAPPPSEQNHPTIPESAPPNSHPTAAPASNAPVSAVVPGMPASPPPSSSIFPAELPSPPPDIPMRPSLPRNSAPVKPIPKEPPTSPPGNSAPVKPAPKALPPSPPVQNQPRILALPPRISKETAATPIPAPAKGTSNHNAAPVSHSSSKAPTASKPIEQSKSAPPPRLFSKSGPGFDLSTKHHHEKGYKITPAPLSHVIPPPTSGFSSVAAPPISHPFPDDRFSPVQASPPSQPKIPYVSPEHSPSKLSPRTAKARRPPPLRSLPPPPPLRSLPPPPPHTDCVSLTCQEPLAYGTPASPCVCVLPIQVGLRLTVALYTFFPLVSELATEIAAGVFLNQSQVRIMGANAAEDDPDKTIIHTDLLPLGRKFDDTTAYLIFQRFWNKQISISTSFFGDYDVLYVRYPGLPPSPPLPPLATGVIPSKPYPGQNNKTRTMQPLGVDISRTPHKHGLSGSTVAAIILSCLVAVVLSCVLLWVLIFRHKHLIFHPDPTPPSTMRSLAKSSGMPVSTIGSRPSSPSFSLNSSIAACAGSARTFSSSDIERATDFFNETRVIGEGGFGRVYSGVFEDGTKVAIKILKRYDQQGSREFFAEVEMLSRLHHRNLVKLIGICVEDRTRCLVYELIPNGSVESHLHGIDKETSPLDWSARLKIALGAARALSYLHEDSCPRVIHRDFKASNILLEDDFTPKVSDFGLARAALDEENRHISTRVMGTFGYLAPEYAMTGHLLIKSDVYSYGVVLLELLTGRKPVDMFQPPGRENLVSWARPLLTNREHLEPIIDPSLGPDVPFDNIAKVAAIASMCVQPEVSHRPFMGEVVQALRLVCSDDDEVQELRSRGSSHENFSIILDDDQDYVDRSDRRLVEALLMTPSSADGYDHRFDDDGSEVSLSELLSSAAAAQGGGAQLGSTASFRRYCSSSGPIRTTSKAKQMWNTMRRVTRGSVSEHIGGGSGALRRLWPGSH